MAVYIDNFNAPFRNMSMCHLIADTTAELLKMADCIGVQRKWIQDEGEYSEHFDICQTKKRKAIAAGAIEITFREFARKVNLRPGSPFYDRAHEEKQADDELYKIILS